MELKREPVLRRVIIKTPEDIKDFVRRIKTGVIKILIKDPSKGKINLYLLVDNLKIIGAYAQIGEGIIFQGDEALTQLSSTMKKPKLANYYSYSLDKLKELLNEHPDAKTNNTYLLAPYIDSGKIVTPEHREKMDTIFSAVRALSEEDIPTKVDLKNVPPMLKGYANIALINITKALHSKGMTPKKVVLEFEEKKRTFFRSTQNIIHVRIEGVPNTKEVHEIVREQLEPILQDIRTLADTNVELDKILIIS